MRTSFLIPAAAGAALLAAPAARAQGIPVFDASRIVQSRLQQAETIARWLRQDGQMVESIRETTNVVREANNVYREATNIYNTLHGVTDFQGAVYAFQSLLGRAPLPAEMEDLRKMLMGTGGGPAMLGAMVQRFMGDTLKWNPAGEDQDAVRIREAAQTTAGQMALADRTYEASNDHRRGFQELEAAAGRANSAADRLDVGNRAAIAQGQAQTLTNQMLALQMQQQAERDRQQGLRVQRQRKSAEAMVAAADSIIRGGGGGGTGGLLRGGTGGPAPGEPAGQPGMADPGAVVAMR